MRTILPILTLCAAGQMVRANLVSVGNDVISGAGFGTNPRILTIQATGDASTESGCNAWNGSTLVVGSSACTTGANSGGNEPNPHGSPKDSSPTLSQLGYTQASDVGIIFDATEPGHKSGNSLTIDSLILKFYSSTGALLLSEALTPAPFVLDQTTTGNGKTDFLFVLDENGVDQVNRTIFSLSNSGSVHIALESTMSAVKGGPESFLALADPWGDPTRAPEPGSLLLIATGLFGAGLFRRRLKR